VGLAALNVQADNVAAMACYSKFGFEARCSMVESWVTDR
jgi:ribosomal protein S18 acetylase RimI-like enzyme